MKITLKLVLAVLASTALVLTVDGYLRVQRELHDFQADMINDLQALGRVFERVLTDVWRHDGQPRVIELIADANASNDRIHFRWVAFDNAEDGVTRLGLSEEQVTLLQRGEAVTTSASKTLGKPMLFQHVPIKTQSGIRGWVELSESLAPVHAHARSTVLRTVGSWIVLVGLNGCLLIVIGLVMIDRPMRQVIEKTRRVGMGELDGPLHVQGRDEFAEIADSLNQMCDQLNAGQARERAGVAARIETLEQLRHADRLKTVGNLTSGLAHELGTPLNVVLGRANLIASGRLDPEELLKSTGIIKEQVQRMTATIRQVLDFARRKSPQRTRMDLRLLAQQTLEMLAPLAKERQATLVFHPSAQPVHVQIEPEQIEQVLVNLVTNAWQAMPEGGRVEIEVRSQDGRPPLGLNQATAPYGCLTISDQGLGIRDDDLPYVFDPFFTTKDVGQGTGLGLSIIYGIVHDHEGWIEAANRPGHGACFSVYLPLKEA